jgi:hypothetical protein
VSEIVAKNENEILNLEFKIFLVKNLLLKFCENYMNDENYELVLQTILYKMHVQNPTLKYYSNKDIKAELEFL